MGDQRPAGAVESILLDLDDLSLDELDSLTHPLFKQSIQRIHQEARDPDAASAGFNASI